MTEMEKMRSGVFYRYDDPECEKSLRHAFSLVQQIRTLTPEDSRLRSLLEELIPGIPDTTDILPPVHCDHGHGIHLGAHIFVNTGCIFLDAGEITIGDHTLLGPNCQILTPEHPMDALKRRLPTERALPVNIGPDCWLGAGVIVCPGVNIGRGCIIGAGSVVTKDIPDYCLAAGNPAKVIRRLSEEKMHLA